MKSLKVFSLGLLLTLTQIAAASTDAGYYRVWQGFKRNKMSSAQFLGQLPQFMNATVSLYGDSLNQYLVAVPPANKPDYVPDEFALVALADEDSYKRIRATTDGQTYSEAHWQLFEKSASKSLPLDLQIPSSLVADRAYDLLGQRNDWSRGKTTFFLGLRKPGLAVDLFLQRLRSHIQWAAGTFKPLGLKGYIVIATDNYEVAYMNWESEEAMSQAFWTPEGKALIEDAATILDTLQWSPENVFNGNSVTTNEFYQTK